PTALLPPALAVAALDAAHPAAREGADPAVTMPRGPPRRHQRSESRAPGLGPVLPHRERRQALQPTRRLRLETAPTTACRAQGSAPASRRSRRVDARVLPERRAPSPARNSPLPGAVL